MSELVDLVTKTGEVSLKAIPRDEVADYPDLHMQIVIVVAFDALGRLLIHRRAAGKKTDPQKYDHICGGVQSGETPEEAAAREGMEETGIALRNIRQVDASINEYGRWRYLMTAEAEGIPTIADPEEVMWVGYASRAELQQKRADGEEFVRGFFEDITLATT